jgi:hypothetical protein
LLRIPPPPADLEGVPPQHRPTWRRSLASWQRNFLSAARSVLETGERDRPAGGGGRMAGGKGRVLVWQQGSVRALCWSPARRDV